MEFRFTIALIYDFDGTLAPGNMQEYDFIPAVGKSNKEFWTEANTLAEEQDADMVLTYMARMIQEAKSKGLSLRREAFQDSGRRVTLFAGVKEWFSRINAYGAGRGIRILHYINSSGLKEIIEGTEIAHEFRKIYLLVPLRRGRHRLLARRGGQLHQQDAVHLQDQQGR